MIGNRLDVSFYKDRFEMVSGIYPNKRLSSIVNIDPTIRFTGVADDTPISFIPMECIDDTFGEVKEQRETTIAQTKGYTRSLKKMIYYGPRLLLACRMGNRPWQAGS